MGNETLCPVGLIREPAGPMGCAGPKCGWWNVPGECCSIKTIAQQLQIGMPRISGELDRLRGTLVRQLDFGGPGVTAELGRLHDSIDARAADVVEKLGQMWERME